MPTPKMTTERFIVAANQVHGDRYLYNQSVYVDKHTPIRIICAIHGEFEMTMHSHVHRKCGCKQCGDDQKRQSIYTIDQLVEAANIIHNNKYDYSQVAFEHNTSMKTKVNIVCPHHGVFKQTLSSHIYNKRGCPSCGYENATDKRQRTLTKKVDQFINDARKIHGEVYDYAEATYVNSHTKLYIRCLQHGPFAVTPIKHLYDKQGCPVCGLSKGELAIHQWLVSHNIQFNSQHAYTGCTGESGRALPFDFWIPTLNLLIEYDGEHHYRSIRYSDASSSDYVQQRVRDEIKTRYAQQNHITLLRIPFWERDNIPHILSAWCKINAECEDQTQSPTVCSCDVSRSQNGVQPTRHLPC